MPVCNYVTEIPSGLLECRPYRPLPTTLQKIHSLAVKKFCPGETRNSQQLALHCLQVAGTGWSWSGVKIAALGSHLVSLEGSKGREAKGKLIKYKLYVKEQRLKLNCFPREVCRWCSCRPSHGSGSLDLSKNNPFLVRNTNWGQTPSLGLTKNLSPISRAGRTTWGTFATSRQEEPG